MKRRELLKYSGLAVASAALYDFPSFATPNIKLWPYGLPPLFCVAYIDPGIEAQKGQITEVAKFPIALVPQDDRRHFRNWRHSVRYKNPDIKLLAYQMVIEETGVPGPGHRIMQGLQDPWVSYLGEYQPTVSYKTAVKKKKFRIFDPRKSEWKKGFIDACSATLESYPYDGLFLDQCSIYLKAAVNPIDRDEMIRSLQDTLLLLRKKYPNKILVANSRYSWSALNGEMNENRENALEKESIEYGEHEAPRYELFHYYMKDHNDIENLKRLMHRALDNKVFFGAGINAQTVQYYSAFDEVLEERRFIVNEH